MEVYSNLKRYDEKGRRVAAFAQVKDEKLEVFLLFCSKKDQFSKKTAKLVYEKFLSNKEAFDGKCEHEKCIYHPEIKTVDILDASRPKWSFLTWMSENFYIEHISVLKFDDGFNMLRKATLSFNYDKKEVEIKTLLK